MIRWDKAQRHTLAACLAVILAAVLCRVYVYSPWDGHGFLDKLANFTRIFLYLGLFALWGVSVHRRVMQAQVRRYLMWVSLLMVAWLTLREFRWHLVWSPDVGRWLWYAYYIPILLILLLALLVSLSLGKPETYRLPPWMGWLFLPTGALLLLVLTNDLHQWVFRFPGGALTGGDLNYTYGPVFYLVTAWGILCAVTAFVVMVSKCRIPRTRKFLWLPLVPFGAALLYVILYGVRLPFVTAALGDLAVFDCLLFTAFFESCIQCGLIQSNILYDQLFRASVDTSAQITDYSYTVQYTAHDTETISREDMKKAETGPVFLPGGRRLHNMPVNGGHVIWTEDISQLLELRETLEEKQEELQEHHAFLQSEYQKEKAHRLVVEQNRLLDLLQSVTRPQLRKIETLTEAYQQAGTTEEKRLILAHIVVLGSYIKRRKDLVLSLDTAAAFPASKLTSALDESFRSLRLLPMKGDHLVQTGRESLDGETVLLAYDFFEAVTETVLDTASVLHVTIVPAGGGLRCSVWTDREGNSEALAGQFPGLEILREEDGVEYRLPLEGGGKV